MRKTMCRTITVTTIESANVSFEKGQPVVVQNPSITVNGVIAEEKALKEVRKVHGLTAQITSLVETQAVYEMSVEDFIKHATKVENTTPEQVAE